MITPIVNKDCSVNKEELFVCLKVFFAISKNVLGRKNGKLFGHLLFYYCSSAGIGLSLLVDTIRLTGPMYVLQFRTQREVERGFAPLSHGFVHSQPGWVFEPNQRYTSVRDVASLNFWRLREAVLRTFLVCDVFLLKPSLPCETATFRGWGGG